MDWQEQSVTIYLYVCQSCREELWAYCQRFSNKEVIIIVRIDNKAGITIIVAWVLKAVPGCAVPRYQLDFCVGEKDIF